MCRTDTTNELLLEHSEDFDQEKNQCVCVIHEVEVDMIKKDNLSLHRYNIFLSCCNLLLCYFRTAMGSIMLMNLFIIIHLN